MSYLKANVPVILLMFMAWASLFYEKRTEFAIFFTGALIVAEIIRSRKS